MASERRIAIAVFAAGVVLALVALARFGDDEAPAPDLADAGCPPQHATLPVLATMVSDDGRSIRVVGPGQACGFATAQHQGTLYVELRKRSEDPTTYDDLECYDLTLRQTLPQSAKASAISPGRRAKADRAQVSSLLASEGGCAEPRRQEPSFIID